MNILVPGSDSLTSDLNDGARADVIRVGQLGADCGRMNLVSIRSGRKAPSCWPMRASATACRTVTSTEPNDTVPA
ncbi:hypothetical protein [Brooklawnia cerclae]|uniref:Uncharacterized protein n=1 Tax=Brooklawnia cerclae TaxID=349934 RepID=A0ABX0SJ63_9ACTN|nr:hypothetical protein [Brooklawnia cerclae]NIH56681.1 hypothetical protein [Brooklawnia cerclae]